MNKSEMEALLINEAKQLPVEKLAEVIDFALFLKQKRSNDAPRKPVSLRGLWKGVDISEQNLTEARTEMWGDFPRDDF